MRSLILRAKKRVFSSRLGLFSAPLGKEGYDFFDLEPYDYASDAKRIDWKSYAKTRELYKKNFSEERSKNIHLIPIFCGSLFFGSSRLKFETLLEATAIIGFSALYAKERLFVQGEPIGNIFEFESYLYKLSEQKLIGKKPSFDPGLFYRSPKSLCIVLSDFLEPIDLTLFSARDDVVALFVLDHLETERVVNEEATLVDTISLAQSSAHLASSMRRYHKNIAAIHRKQKEHFAKIGVDWLELYEDSDVFTKLLYFFRSR
jgi:hypothetical protein